MILLLCSVHATCIICLSVLGERSLLCGSTWGFFYPPRERAVFLFFFSQHGKFFLLHRIKGLGAENVVQCADCAEATWLWFGDSTHWTTFHSWFENVHGLKFWLEMGFSHLPPSCLTKLLVKRHHRVRLICIVSFNVLFFFFSIID